MSSIIEGSVVHITYQNETNGYTVLDLDVDNALICAVGHMPSVMVGEILRLTGEFINNPAYGEQFSVEFFERTTPKEIGSILMYLSSGIIKGIGEATARKIVDKFGIDSLKILTEEPERLSEIKGITKDKALSMHASFIEKRACQNTIMFLQPYGVTPEFAIRAHKALGADAVAQIKANPYVLCDKIQGIGFPSADKIAMAMQVENANQGRIKSGIKHVLGIVSQTQGHTYLPESLLTEYAASLLNVDEDLVIDQLIPLIKDKEIFAFQSYDEGKCYQLAIYYHAERYIASKIKSLARIPSDNELNSLNTIIELSELKSNIDLSDEQKEAVKASIFGGVTVITGGPGTGKTTIIKTIIDCLDSMALTYSLAAPTGRAAKRMADACQREAKTIHRLLEFEYSKGETASFSKNQDNPLESDFIIVDEVSMMDTLLMNSLLKAVAPETGIIFLGDSDQLPSVGAGSVLKDIIDSDFVKTLHLTYIYRQAAESMIVTNAHKINAGEMPFFNKKDNDFFLVSRTNPSDIASTIAELCSGRLERKYGFNAFSDIQVITPIKKSLVGTLSLNERLQAVLNPPDKKKAEVRVGEITFREGDKVMQTENDYNIEWTKNGDVGKGIFNGDMGIIEVIDRHYRVAKVLFDDERVAIYSFDNLIHLTLSYAITVHKSQGSEFECVVMPVYRAAPQLMTRNLFYTAVTRAKSLVVLVGMIEATEEMVNNISEKKRYSALLDKFME